ncbi:MAG: hypothetical protein LQ338_000675 [Usnochroma carphineum]|nr:MAG: hypothetical protein LQ338_000675 [Usnochroma carphineum]
MRRLAFPRWPGLSIGRMYRDIRTLGHGVLRDLTRNAGNDERVHDRRRDDEDDYSLARPEASPRIPPRFSSRQPTRRDYEIMVLGALELSTRFRELADDTNPLNLALSEAGLLDRRHILGDYRTNAFLEDLADGYHDEWPEALHNQEYDSYYSDLEDRVSSASPKAAIAMGIRDNPQPCPRIALTIPPVYEPSDLPSYTATILPPEYSQEVPRNHVARDVPPCIAADCPVRRLGIKQHSCGLYHHDGQVGPVTISQGTWLPSFGRSNPPPSIWSAYNYMVLGIADSRQEEAVKAFIRYHGAPWTPKSTRPPSKLGRNADIPKDLAEFPSYGASQVRMGRIPWPPHHDVTLELGHEGLKQNRGLETEDFIETYVNSMHHYTHPGVPPGRHHRRSNPHIVANSTPNYSDRPQAASGANIPVTGGDAPINERLQPDPLFSQRRSCHRRSNRRITANSTSLVPEPLQIPRRRVPQLPRTYVPSSEASQPSQPSHHQRAGHDRSAVQVPTGPALADFAQPRVFRALAARSPNNQVPSSGSSEFPASARPERSRQQHDTYQSQETNSLQTPTWLPVVPMVSPTVSTRPAPTNMGAHIRRQPFYGHVYNLDRPSTRRPLAGITQFDPPRLRISTAIAPVSPTTHLRTTQNSPYPWLSFHHADEMTANADRAGGILGTFDWELNDEGMHDDRN